MSWEPFILLKISSKYAHEKDIPVVLDGAQSVPHLQTDVQDIDCDFLAFLLIKC